MKGTARRCLCRSPSLSQGCSALSEDVPHLGAFSSDHTEELAPRIREQACQGPRYLKPEGLCRGVGPTALPQLPCRQPGGHGLKLGGTLGTLTPTCFPTSPRAVKMAWDECGHACTEQVFAEMKGEAGESPHPITPDDGTAPAVQDRWGGVCAERRPREAAGDLQGPPCSLTMWAPRPHWGQPSQPSSHMLGQRGRRERTQGQC